MEKEELEMEVGSSSDSSSENDEDDNELEKKAEELETTLSANKYLYDAHIELVGLYERLADLTSMRLAYQRFYETYPLTPELWMKLLKIEVSLANTPQEHEKLCELFEKATQDYLSVKLWLQYAEYSLSTSDLEKTRSILEKAVNTAGLHVEQGSLLWDTLREFEMCQLQEPSAKEYPQQLQRIVDIFKRQLSVPLLFMDKTYGEWKEFQTLHADVESTKTPIEWSYKNALKLLQEYKPFEDRLMQGGTDVEVWAVYRDYIKAVKDPSNVICLYERALEKLCLVPEVWIQYLGFVLNLGDVALKVTERALRNVTWSGDLWVLCIRILEKLERPHEEILKCFEMGISSIQDGLSLWMAYLDYHRRNKPDQLLKLFEHAEEQLLQDYDPCYTLTRYHARVAVKNGDLEKFRSCWKTIMNDPKMKTSVQHWLEYVNLERRYGTVPQARAIFNRALVCCKEWPQFIGDEFILFEQEEGVLEDVMKTTEKVRKAISEVVKVEMVNNETAQDQGGRNRKRKTEHADEQLPKRKSNSGEKNVKSKKDLPTEVKHRKVDESLRKPVLKNQGPPADLDPTKSVFISNISPFITREHIQNFFPKATITLATNNKGESRCFGYAQFQTECEAEEALKRDRELLEKRPVFISKCKVEKTERDATFKYATTIEDNKLFVRGLPVKYSKEQVEEIFKPYNCTDVRLVLHKSGQPKGLAYVDFGNSEDAAKAVKETDRTVVENLVISVAISAPPKKSAKVGELKVEPNRNARTRLQVPLVPRSVQKSNVEVAGNGQAASKKSNDDFRNMFLNKKV